MADVVEIGVRNSIEDQARKWLIRMDGDELLSNTEKAALGEWINRSAWHREELTRLTQFWNQANILAELMAGVESAGHGQGIRRAMSWTRPILVAAGSVISSVILVYCSLQSVGEAATRTYATAIGQQKTIALSDGSSIHLNTNSRVDISFSGKARRVRLWRGEALFFATPDAGRVFEVRAADSIIRASGTEFVADLEGRTVAVMVTKGVVDVSDLRGQRTTVEPRSINAAASLGELRAGEATRFESGSGRMEVHWLGEAELQRRLAWLEGYLIFAGEPLSEVVAQLNRYSAKTLVIGDPELASIAIGGRFRIDDLYAVLDLMNTTFGIRAHEVNDRTIRLESQPVN